MTTESRTIQILDPRLEEVPEEVGVSAVLPSLEGKVVGLLENRKYHADAFLEELQSVLVQKYHAKKVIYRSKFSFSAPLRRRRPCATARWTPRRPARRRKPWWIKTVDGSG